MLEREIVCVETWLARVELLLEGVKSEASTVIAIAIAIVMVEKVGSKACCRLLFLPCPLFDHRLLLLALLAYLACRLPLLQVRQA